MGKWDHSIVLYLLNLSRPPSGLRSPCSCPPPHDQVVLVRAKAWESWNKKVTGSLPAGAFFTWNSVAASGAGALRYSAKGAKSSCGESARGKASKETYKFFLFVRVSYLRPPYGQLQQEFFLFRRSTCKWSHGWSCDTDSKSLQTQVAGPVRGLFYFLFFFIFH